MRQFDYYKPQTFTEAFKLLTLPDKAVYPLAGATDLIPHTRDEVWQPDIVVDVKGLPGLRDIKVEGLEPCCGCTPGDCLYVGAAVQMNEIARSELVKSHWDILAQGAASMGNEQVRNRATLGGNLGTASPAADSAPALLVLDATVLVKGPQGDRSIPIETFFVGPKRNALQKGELIAGIFIPKPPAGTVGVYEKLSRRKAGDLSVVGIAALATPTGSDIKWRIALGAVAPTPIRSPQAEAILDTGHDQTYIEEAASAAFGCSSPIDDVRASAEYRQAMIVQITQRAIHKVLENLDIEP